MPDNNTTEDRIRELQAQKIVLLDKYGVFGGGHIVTVQHENINRELESLGVDPNS